MKYIQITKEARAIVDDEDYEKMSQYSWYLSKGYAYRNQYLGGGKKNQRQKHFAMHREIMAVSPGIYIDHKNGNPLDNRKSNLRPCTQSQNSANQKLRSNNTSGHKGVYWSKVAGKWMAYIKVNYKRINLGYYVDIEDAIKAYEIASKNYFGKFARIK